MEELGKLGFHLEIVDKLNNYVTETKKDKMAYILVDIKTLIQWLESLKLQNWEMSRDISQM